MRPAFVEEEDGGLKYPHGVIQLIVHKIPAYAHSRMRLTNRMMTAPPIFVLAASHSKSLFHRLRQYLAGPTTLGWMFRLRLDVSALLQCIGHCSFSRENNRFALVFIFQIYGAPHAEATQCFYEKLADEYQSLTSSPYWIDNELFRTQAAQNPLMSCYYV